MARGRSARSHAVEGGASNNQGATSPHDQTVMHTQTALSTHPATTTQSQNEVVAQLLPALVAIHKPIERLAGNRITQPLVSTTAPPIVESIIGEAAQVATPANGDNSSAAKQPAIQFEEPSL